MSDLVEAGFGHAARGVTSTRGRHFLWSRHVTDWQPAGQGNPICWIIILNPARGYANGVRTLTLDTLLLYIAANLRRLRQQRGITQEQLAEAAGIELRTMQAIEVGRQNMSLGTLVRLANALDVSPGVLLRSATMPEIKRGRPRKRPAGT
ncbi:helix-turn-helix domain-containing protein [Sorangium sp. So ce1335]|uniref:helix-turn-helix domain-containing protein n=1 Tax=Sorangium sp. So ce1335 TaxID=3133335 RepID=UPI003F5DB750